MKRRFTGAPPVRSAARTTVIGGLAAAVAYGIAKDDLHKANISGDAYYMEVPNQSADAPFQDWHHTSFVNYLRIAFRWGGFPGFVQPNRGVIVGAISAPNKTCDSRDEF